MTKKRKYSARHVVYRSAGEGSFPSHYLQKETGGQHVDLRLKADSALFEKIALVRQRTIMVADVQLEEGGKPRIELNRNVRVSPRPR